MNRGWRSFSLIQHSAFSIVFLLYQAALWAAGAHHAPVDLQIDASDIARARRSQEHARPGNFQTRTKAFKRGRVDRPLLQFLSRPQHFFDTLSLNRPGGNAVHADTIRSPFN